MNSSTIICPKCHAEIPVEEALGHSISEKLEKEFDQKLIAREQELTKKIKSSIESEKKLLEEELAKKDKQLDESRQIELDLRKQKLNLEEEKKNFEVEKQRQLDAERQIIRAKAEAEVVESMRMKDMEKDKVISDLRKSLEDAQRKAAQGSQQLQGEVQELDLEQALKSSFIYDVVEPVGKGVRGADLRQVVKTQIGNVCGVILWESKRTKAWSAEWVTKLKDDLRSEKANVPVIVSTVLPDEAKSGFGLVDGVWVVSPALYLPLAEMIRQKLIDVARERFVSQNQTGKAEALYQYIVSDEFRQQMEVVVESYQAMLEQINKERVAYEKMWSQREAQVKRLMASTGRIYGSIRGVGAGIASISGLELPDSIE